MNNIRNEDASWAVLLRFHALHEILEASPGFYAVSGVWQVRQECGMECGTDSGSVSALRINSSIN